MHKEMQVFFLLYPIYWFSKYTGVLPLNYTITERHIIDIFLDKTVLKISTFYLIIMNFNNLYNDFSAFALYFEKIAATDNSYIFNIFGNILQHIYLLSIINFVLFKTKLVVKVLNDLNKMYKIICIQNFIFVRKKLYCYLIFTHFIYFYFHISFLVQIKLSFLEVCTWMANIITGGNQISIELQFWSFSYVFAHCFESLNHQLEKLIIYSRKMESKLNKLRTSYETLTDMCNTINAIYNNCVLSFMCVRCLYIQYDIYSFMIHLYGYIMHEEEHNFSRELVWILFQIYRVLQQFWVCNRLEKQVCSMVRLFFSFN
jgi:hypothetical protein